MNRVRSRRSSWVRVAFPPPLAGCSGAMIDVVPAAPPRRPLKPPAPCAAFAGNRRMEAQLSRAGQLKRRHLAFFGAVAFFACTAGPSATARDTGGAIPIPIVASVVRDAAVAMPIVASSPHAPEPIPTVAPRPNAFADAGVPTLNPLTKPLFECYHFNFRLGPFVQGQRDRRRRARLVVRR